MQRVVLTKHAIFRLFERGISVRDAKQIAVYGKVARVEVGGIIKKVGIGHAGRMITVVIKRSGARIIILTVYYGNNIR